MTPARHLADLLGVALDSKKLAALEESLASGWALARETWPGVLLSREAFVEHLAAHLPKPPATGLKALSSLHTADLYLTCACLHADRAALAHFERALMPGVAGYVASVNRAPELIEEVRQRLRSTLFIAEAGATPKIAQYAGAAALGGWLRVVSIRIARNLGRRPKAQVALDSDDGAALLSQSPNPELAYLKTRYRAEFREAFQAALAGLSAKDRNLVSLYFLEGLSSAVIGRSYGVHGATVRLWIKQCRETLFEATTRYLNRHLKIPRSEMESLIGLVHSQFDVTVSRLLKAPER